MNVDDDVLIKHGLLRGCEGILAGVINIDDTPVYRVRLTDVTSDAASKGYRLGDEVDMDRYELQVKEIPQDGK